MLDSRYVDDEMSWEEWIIKYVASLQLEEASAYEKYVLAGGEPEKYIWIYDLTKGTASDSEVDPSKMTEMVEQRLVGSRQSAKLQGTFDEYAQYRQLKKIYRTEDGVYYDEDGKQIEMPDDYLFVPKGGIQAP